jgi:hypothetical protein
MDRAATPGRGAIRAVAVASSVAVEATHPRATVRSLAAGEVLCLGQP